MNAQVRKNKSAENAKKAFNPPVLKRFGTVRELTRTILGIGKDSSGPGMSMG